MPLFYKHNGAAVPIISDPNVINDNTPDNKTAYSSDKIVELLGNKVDKVQGKGLSTNDFSDEEKQKLDGMINDSAASDSNTYSSNKIEAVVDGAKCVKYSYSMGANQWNNNTLELNISSDHINLNCYNTIELTEEAQNNWKYYGISVKEVWTSVDNMTDEYTLYSIVFECIVTPTNDIDFTIASFPSVSNVRGGLVDSYSDKSIAPIILKGNSTRNVVNSSEGNVKELVVYGKSEVVDGSIKSAGEGWSTVDLGTLTWSYAVSQAGTKLFISQKPTNIKSPPTGSDVPAIVCAKYPVKSWEGLNMGADAPNGITIFATDGSVRVVDSTYTDATTFKTAMSGVILAYEEATPTNNTIAVKTDNGTGIDGTMAAFTTGTPLRATLDGTTRDEMHYNGITGEVITRCEIVNDEVVPLATPVTTPFTATENASFAALQSYSPATKITINDSPEFEFSVYSGNDNGKAVAEIKEDVDKLIDGMPKTYSLEISDSDWNNGTATVSVVSSKIKRYNYNVLKIDNNDVDDWMEFGVKGVSTTVTSVDGVAVLNTITFECDPNNVPDVDLSFDIVSQTRTGDNLTPLFFEEYGYADSELDNNSVYPVQNKVITAALGNKANTSALDNYVEKEAGKSLSTNDYTDADKALVQNSPITVSATGTDLTLSTSSGNINALTVYGKSEVVDGSIISAGEGWATVRLADLTWTYWSNKGCFTTTDLSNQKIITVSQISPYLCTKYTTTQPYIYGLWQDSPNKSIFQSISEEFVVIHDTDYTTLADFVASLGDATLCYHLADSTQGNTIAVKTDNGTGIDGTMAEFETGTPLYGVSETVRDVMTWDGSAGTVTKVCGKVRLADLAFGRSTSYNEAIFYSGDMAGLYSTSINAEALCSKYAYFRSTSARDFADNAPDKSFGFNTEQGTQLYIKDLSYNTPTDFIASLGDAELVYEVATPTSTPLTASENASLAGLRTFAPQTHAQNNAGATMTVEAYAGTANGKAVQELKQDVQSEISALKIMQSDTLTLTVADWSNNAQTIAYAHDTAKRNVIDVDPSSVEEWASCGVLATAETATSITFTCKTVPENALTFKVTSMGVN